LFFIGFYLIIESIKNFYAEANRTKDFLGKKEQKKEKSGRENPSIVVFPFEGAHKCFQLRALRQRPSMMMLCLTTAPSFDDIKTFFH
jgi:hypothetical protein